ncbi:sodium-dependent transporter [Luminiphilus sp.]|nr:sodium-dependent transporter [Luminiphilus sp.]MDA9711582.1 sodium-dependent transporter [Luminiphilus sp.]
MAVTRGEFQSRAGFILAAAGSAVGLGNIWAFPTQAASNGGAAFLITYLILAFVLAYPALMAELLIGRHTHRNMVQALESLAESRPLKLAGRLTGLAGLLTASLILSFYAIVAGWMLGFSVSYPLGTAGLTTASEWLVTFTPSRNLLLMLGFMGLTMTVVLGGVENGIERWSCRLMPILIATLVVLAAYVLTLDGALIGLQTYLLPDFDKVLSGDLLLDALGSAFFSLSLGVGTMLIYGSYLSDRENVPRVGAQVALVDVGIAVLAGFLILPAMYVANARGVPIFNETGGLLSEDTLIFSVLPALFDTMSTTGAWLATAFFSLMSIAALTSSISMLEVPVAYLIEQFDLSRRGATLIAGVGIALFSALVAVNFDTLFGLVITVSTRYSQPMLGIAVCIFAGWIWHRDALLQELSKSDTNATNAVFLRIWPFYVKWLCPVIIGVIVIQSIV